MNISPINYANYQRNVSFERKYNTNNNKSNADRIHQKELNNLDNERVLSMLNQVCNKVIISNSLDAIDIIVQYFQKKYDKLNEGSVGIMMIPNNQLEKYTANKMNNINKIDLSKFMGLFVAIGNKSGSVDTWTKAYESKLLLLPNGIV